MAPEATSAKLRRRPHKRRLKRMYSRSLVNLMNRVDFLGILNRVAESEAGRPWLDKLAALEDSWPQKEAIKERAAELTVEQMRADGQEADPAQAMARVEDVACWYDLDIHRRSSAALTVILNHLFVQQDPNRPFVSADGRDIAHLDKLRAYQEQGLGVVYLVNHSSHLDEFLVDILLANELVRLPLFAAGANMMAIKSLAKLLMAGSYVVQRRGADRLGLAALYNYCRAVTELGGQQAIFLEAWHGGARSRDGSLRYPRRLVTLRGALDTDREIVIQPVAISYSAVPEDLPLAARQSARSWVRGMGLAPTLARGLLHPKSFLWRSLKGVYGRAYVTMPQPVLFSDLKKEHAHDNLGGLSLDEFTSLTAIREIARCKKVMASQLTARGLVRIRQGRDEDLVTAMERERERMVQYHQSAFDQDPDWEDFIVQNSMKRVAEDGLAMLKRRGTVARFRRDERKLPLVKCEAGLSFYATHGDRRIYSPTADQNLVVVGANDWGFALTYLVGHRILEEKRYLNASLTLYDSRTEAAVELGVMRHPPGRFQDYRLPKNAFVTSDAISAFRKASDIILASSPPTLEEKARSMLEAAEQPLKVVVVTYGFEPQSHRLPCQVVMDLARELGRDDVEVYALVGPVSDAQLVEGKPAMGVLAGPEKGRRKLADLFNWPPAGVLEAEDPLGNQAAAVLARIYAFWGLYLARRGQVSGAAQTGFYMAEAASEAARLGMALGGRSETFAAGAPAWTSVLVAEGLAGANRDFARKLVRSAKDPADAPAAAAKLRRQMISAGDRPAVLDDIKSAYLVAEEHGLESPLLAEAYKAVWGEDKQ